MKVAGIDVSLTGTGVAIHEAGGLTYVREHGEDGKRGASFTSREERIGRLVDQVLFDCADAELAVFEAHDFGAKYSASAHDRSGVFWILVRELRAQGTRVAQATPQTLKMYQSGSGSASKDQMLVDAVRRYPTVDVRSNNQADAMAALSMGVRFLELAPLETVWNQKMAQAMEKAEWP
jgi:crossover junction endodeoxyribonuclease RuvC